MSRPILLALLVGVAACSSGSHIAAPIGEPDDTVPVDTVVAETFEIAPYRDEPADVRTDPEHDVPASLMGNRADAGIELFVDGFRVQIFSTLDQEEAAAAQDAARSFWNEKLAAVDSVSGLPHDLAVYGLFRQPYYRIRVGDFVDREKADRVALLFGERFEGAVVVPDIVKFVK